MTTERSDAYETKTVRFHLEERGTYFYVMMTRFDGEESILSELGYGTDHIQFQIMTNNKQERLADTDLFNLAHRSGYPLTDLWPFDLLYALDADELLWDEIEDGQKLTEADMAALLPEADA